MQRETLSARLPADLCCSNDCVEEIPSKHSQSCKGCINSSKIALELEQCLQIIVADYEQEFSRLRMEISVLKSNHQECNEKIKNQIKSTSENEYELRLYKAIPSFKEDMRRLGDNLWPSNKTTSILYYQAAAMNGCTESCVRVAMHFLESEISSAPLDYNKAKVLVVTMHLKSA